MALIRSTRGWVETEEVAVVPAPPGYQRLEAVEGDDGHGDEALGLPVIAFMVHYSGDGFRPHCTPVSLWSWSDSTAVELPDGRVVDSGAEWADRAAWLAAEMARLRAGRVGPGEDDFAPDPSPRGEKPMTDPIPEIERLTRRQLLAVLQHVPRYFWPESPARQLAGTLKAAIESAVRSGRYRFDPSHAEPLSLP